jgi:glyoxylase-like metal-dependent hydrolase (beta-lactamase superfamily II)
MKKIIVLDIKFRFGDTEDIIHPVVLKDDTSMVLIDCGYTGFLMAIEQVMEENGLSCKDLTHVVITHQDHDHMGSLLQLKNKYPQVKVVAGKEEAPYISGQIKSLRLQQAEAIQPHLPEEQKESGEAFLKILKNVETAEVDIEVQDGDIFNWCGGCTIIGTPGHTTGHISIYINEEQVLIAGDAATIENGELVIANPQFTLDFDKAKESLQKIKAYGAKEIICYHGGIFTP